MSVLLQVSLFPVAVVSQDNFRECHSFCELSSAVLFQGRLCLVPRVPRCHGVFKVGSCIFGALCPGLAGQERAIIDWTEHFGAFENAEANAGAIESNASLVISFFVGIISCFAFW